MGRGGVAGRDVVVDVQLAARRVKEPEVEESKFLEDVLYGRSQDAQPVAHAAAEIDGGSFGEVLGRAGKLADAELEVEALRQHLIVKDEAVRILGERQLGQDLAGEGAKAGVVFRELGAEKEILKGGQQAVRYVLIVRHAAPERAAADDSRTEHDVVDTRSDHAGHRRDQERRVLVVGVN